MSTFRLDEARSRARLLCEREGHDVGCLRHCGANIQIAQTPDSVHTPNARGMPEDLATLEAAVLKMRALGVTKWNGIELGPEPSAATSEEPSEPTADERLKRMRAERMRIASLASGGPVPAVGRSKQ